MKKQLSAYNIVKEIINLEEIEPIEMSPLGLDILHNVLTYLSDNNHAEYKQWMKTPFSSATHEYWKYYESNNYSYEETSAIHKRRLEEV